MAKLLQPIESLPVSRMLPSGVTINAEIMTSASCEAHGQVVKRLAIVKLMDVAGEPSGTPSKRLFYVDR